MHAVGSSENVEKTAGRITGHEDALCNELPPRAAGLSKKERQACVTAHSCEAGEIKP